MKYLIRIAILICCLGCSGEPDKPTPSGTPDQTVPRQSAGAVGSPGDSEAQPTGEATTTDNHLSPERWTASVFGASGSAGADVDVSLQDQALTFVIQKNVGRVDFRFNRLLEGDFRIVAQIRVQSDMTVRSHMGPTATNAWVQVSSADGPRRRAAVPVNLPGPSSPAEIEIVRTGDQIRCLCSGQQMGGGRFDNSAQLGLWINGPGKISLDELQIQATGLTELPIEGASPLAADARSTGGATAGKARTSGPLVSFEDWEVPRSGPGYLLDAIADAVDLSRDSQGIRFAHARSGPHVSVRWKPPLDGNFRATLRLVLPTKPESKWGTIGLQAMPAVGSGKMITISLPAPEADQPRECTAYVERYGGRITCRIDGVDEARVTDIAGPVGLKLLLTGDVHCWLTGIKTEELQQIPPSLVAAKEVPPERKQPTAPPIIGQHTVSQRLPARVDEVVAGGAGRFLVLRFTKLNKLGLFDIEAGNITATMPLKGLPLLAVGLDSLVTIDPETGIICRYGLSALKLQATSMLSLPLMCPVRTKNCLCLARSFCTDSPVPILSLVLTICRLTSIRPVLAAAVFPWGSDYGFTHEAAPSRSSREPTITYS